MGKVVAMTTDVNKSSDLVTKEFSIPGNVVTSCIAYDTLYHSTGVELYKTEIQEMLLQQPKDKTPIKSLTLGYGAIVAITTKTISQQPPVVTIAMCTKTGKTLHIDHPIEQKAQKCSKQNQGARIKDLLAGINNIGQQLTYQKEIDQVQNSELEQLHLASHLASYHSNHSGLTPSKQNQHSGIDCCINVTTENYGSHISYKLVATIENQTHITLSEKWVFLVTLHQMSHKEHPKQKVALKSKSVQISRLPPKGFQRLDLGIDQQTLESLPLNGSCSLVYTCEPSHGLHSNNAQHSNIKHSNVLVIPIATQVLNITHFMRLNNDATTNPTKLQNNCRIYSDSELAQILKEVAGCQPGTHPNLETEEETLGFVGYHSTSIVVPTEQLKVDLRSEGVNCKNDTDVCKCLIWKLFPHLCEVIMTSQVRLLTHKGHHITLGVKVGSGEQVVIEIQSENLQAMCETSIAIKQHIQGLKMRMLNIPMVEELRPFIHQTECLRTDLLSAQEAVLLGDKSVTTADVTQLYHRLRQIHIPHT
ncbi:unnamed protein product [Owenia fusiformis]|uniref:Uncharacterized protein n=2 Tax=Owenia fusiformis TaxID=6347 RepID=A0A8J1TC68_OWEFU|nr:unnamed protein product [Owenia fusiformis]